MFSLCFRPSISGRLVSTAADTIDETSTAGLPQLDLALRDPRHVEQDRRRSASSAAPAGRSPRRPIERRRCRPCSTGRASARHWQSARADFAARVPASPGTRPCGDRCPAIASLCLCSVRSVITRQTASTPSSGSKLNDTNTGIRVPSSARSVSSTCFRMLPVGQALLENRPGRQTKTRS